MTGAVQTADSAAPATGNATLLSATGEPPAEPTTPPPAEPKEPVEPGPETDPADPPGEGDPPEVTEPEAYTFTAPEGVTLDADAVEVFTPVAKEMKLSQEQAQKLVGVYADLQRRQAEAHAAQVAEWAKAVTADKEIGGKHWPETRALVARARNQFASPELLELMESSGFGNHPAVIKHFALLGKQIADDNYALASGPPVEQEDFAAKYFRTMPKREKVSS